MVLSFQVAAVQCRVTDATGSRARAHAAVMMWRGRGVREKQSRSVVQINWIQKRIWSILPSCQKNPREPTETLRECVSVFFRDLYN